MHCLCPDMNNARGAEERKKKKKKRQTQDVGSVKCTSQTFGMYEICQLVLLFSLFLLLFMGPTALFGTIHRSYFTIPTNIYIYLQYFQQKVFSFSKISGSQIDPKANLTYFGSSLIFIYWLNNIYALIFFFHLKIYFTCLLRCKITTTFLYLNSTKIPFSVGNITNLLNLSSYVVDVK